MPVTTCCSTISSSPQISVPGGSACGSMSLGLVEARAHEDAHVVHHAELDRAHLQHLRAERSEFQHLLIGDLVEALGARHHPRVGGVDAVHVGVDVAARGLDRGRDRDRRGIGAAAAERGDAAGVLVQALEAGDHRDLAALLEAGDQLAAVDGEDARRAVRVGGDDRKLPALPGAGVDADAFQHDREQPGGDLLAGGDHGVVFAGVVQGGGVAAPAHQLVGLAGHGGDHDGDLVAGVDLALDVLRDIADSVEIGDRGSAEFHHQAGHGDQVFWLRTRGCRTLPQAAAPKGAYT